MLARTLNTLFAAFLALPLSAVEASRPKLVLFLTVDQARGDYLERFRPALSGGLATLLDQAVVFENAHHFHATTVTAAGHASLATGLFPSHSGIVGNDWFDRAENRSVYCVEDRATPLLRPAAGTGRGTWTTSGRSPKNLLGSSLGDWMKTASPETKVYSIGGKDRSSVLMGGKHANGVYWYDARSGQWVTSQYYASEYPDWVRQLHQRRSADEYFGVTWEPIPVDPELLRSMEIVASGSGTSDAGIPKSLGRTGLLPDVDFYAALFDSPFIESHLLRLARTLVRAERVGQNETTDFLALSFSSVDAVGHAYGPNSREVLDAVIRLDRELGRFFDFLEQTIGMANVAIALSADHGVAPLPEYWSARGFPAGRLSTKDFECFQNVGRMFRNTFGKADWFLAPHYFDEEVLASRNVNRAAVEAFFARELSSCPSVARVWTRTEIESAGSSYNGDSAVEPMLTLYRNSYHPERSPDLFLQLEKWHVDRTRGTTHGSPWEYDTHVPGLLLWPGVKPRVIKERVNTVDVPVTLASLLGIEVPADLDGVDRSEAIR